MGSVGGAVKKYSSLDDGTIFGLRHCSSSVYDGGGTGVGRPVEPTAFILVYSNPGLSRGLLGRWWRCLLLRQECEWVWRLSWLQPDRLSLRASRRGGLCWKC